MSVHSSVMSAYMQGEVHSTKNLQYSFVHCVLDGSGLSFSNERRSIIINVYFLVKLLNLDTIKVLLVEPTYKVKLWGRVSGKGAGGNM